MTRERRIFRNGASQRSDQSWREEKFSNEEPMDLPTTKPRSNQGRIDRGLPVRRCDKATRDALLGKRGQRTENRAGDPTKKFHAHRGRKERTGIGNFSAWTGGGKTAGKAAKLRLAIGKYEKNCQANRGIEFRGNS